jgi:hypothetical protein
MRWLDGEWDLGIRKREGKECWVANEYSWLLKKDSMLEQKDDVITVIEGDVLRGGGTTTRGDSLQIVVIVSQ